MQPDEVPVTVGEDTTMKVVEEEEDSCNCADEEIKDD